MLEHFLKNFIKVGTLNLKDSQGNNYSFGATPLPQVSIHLHSKKIENQLLYSPMLALGEGYMNGDLTVEKGSIFDFLMFCAMNDAERKPSFIEELVNKFEIIRKFLHQHNPVKASKSNVAHHYDLSEDLYRLFLDKDMQYSCAYFKDIEDDLETAQKNKKLHLAAKLKLKPGHKVLDIGSGWGGLAIALAQETGADVTGLTLSEEQHRVATQRAKEAGLEDRVRFHLRDYRHEKEKYDRIVSVGMFEHVGIKHYREFFDQVRALLKEDGLAVLHSIGCSDGPSVPNSWLNKYIFPGGYCPALSETLKDLEPSGLCVTDIEILHHHYAETLYHWRARFIAHAEHVIKKWGERFYRMWEFYLASCEVAFRKRKFMVFQIQMVRNPELASLTRDYIQEEENAMAKAKPQAIKVSKKTSPKKAAPKKSIKAKSAATKKKAS